MNILKDASLNLFIDLSLKRFLKYVTYYTESDRHIEETPSTPGQFVFAKALAEELRGMGISDVTVTDNCYVIARLPASKGKESVPSIGFLAHLDTSSEVSGKDVKPVLVESYNGKPIQLAHGLVLDPSLDAGLAAHKGKALVHSGGHTLLGADDKAGIAAIMGAAEYLCTHPEIEHGLVELIFTPDEETGKGLPDFPLESLKSKACYTVDGGPMGELEIECFNAWGANIEFTGKSIHLGTARGIMANACLMAAVFAAMLPRSESPEATDGYYGYYCPLEIKGEIEKASLEVFIRDFDSKNAEKRIANLETFARAVEAQFPAGKVTVNSKVQYLNMKEKINEEPRVYEKLQQAFNNLGLEINQKPIRGGTDGSRLTELGIPTPNYFTGGRNMHSRLEWLSVEELAAASALTAELIRLWAEG
ncbi:MAG: peptidase T [Treponema sp.]|jgi:tripeptide aminopeptidase|nr:peptidase T [Treponema sp.]